MPVTEQGAAMLTFHVHTYRSISPVLTQCRWILVRSGGDKHIYILRKIQSIIETLHHFYLLKLVWTEPEEMSVTRKCQEMTITAPEYILCIMEKWLGLTVLENKSDRLCKKLISLLINPNGSLISGSVAETCNLNIRDLTVSLYRIFRQRWGGKAKLQTAVPMQTRVHPATACRVRRAAPSAKTTRRVWRERTAPFAWPSSPSSVSACWSSSLAWYSSTTFAGIRYVYIIITNIHSVIHLLYYNWNSLQVINELLDRPCKGN